MTRYRIVSSVLFIGAVALVGATATRGPAARPLARIAPSSSPTARAAGALPAPVAAAELGTVRVRVATRARSTDILAFSIAVAGVQKDDGLLLTVVGYERCSDTAPMRADDHAEVFAHPIAAGTLERSLRVPRASRYEITTGLTSSRDEFAPAGHVSTFTSIEEDCP